MAKGFGWKSNDITLCGSDTETDSMLTHKKVGVVGVGGEVCQVDKLIQKEADACLKVQCLLGKVLQCIYQQPTLKLEHCTNKHPRGPVLRKTGNHLLPPKSVHMMAICYCVFGIYGDPSSCVFNILNNETILQRGAWVVIFSSSVQK